LRDMPLVQGFTQRLGEEIHQWNPFGCSFHGL
jgi:hypothetical protein